LLLDDLEQLLAEDPPPEVEPKVKGEPSPQELLDLLREALYHETAWSEMGERNINWGQALTAGAGLGANLALSFLGPGLAAAGYVQKVTTCHLRPRWGNIYPMVTALTVALTWPTMSGNGAARSTGTILIKPMMGGSNWIAMIGESCEVVPGIRTIRGACAAPIVIGTTSTSGTTTSVSVSPGVLSSHPDRCHLNPDPCFLSGPWPA
jgi:hypothetical protein